MRFAPLALIVLALAVVPVAFADDAPPPPPAPAAAPSASAPAAAGLMHGGAALRLQILDLRLDLVRLRYTLACRDAKSDRCVQFTQKVTDRLTTFDGNVQSRIAELKQCTSDSTDAKCKHADKKIEVLTKIDEKLQDALDKLSA